MNTLLKLACRCRQQIVWRCTCCNGHCLGFYDLESWPLESWPLESWPLESWPLESWAMDTTHILGAAHVTIVTVYQFYRVEWNGLVPIDYCPLRFWVDDNLEQVV